MSHAGQQTCIAAGRDDTNHAAASSPDFFRAARRGLGGVGIQGTLVAAGQQHHDHRTALHEVNAIAGDLTGDFRTTAF
jgi:hypothetical protein